jgi:hypothetical protein
VYVCGPNSSDGQEESEHGGKCRDNRLFEVMVMVLEVMVMMLEVTVLVS